MGSHVLIPMCTLASSCPRQPGVSTAKLTLTWAGHAVAARPFLGVKLAGGGRLKLRTLCVCWHGRFFACNRLGKMVRIMKPASHAGVASWLLQRSAHLPRPSGSCPHGRECSACGQLAHARWQQVPLPAACLAVGPKRSGWLAGWLARLARK